MRVRIPRETPGWKTGTSKQPESSRRVDVSKQRAVSDEVPEFIGQIVITADVNVVSGVLLHRAHREIGCGRVGRREVGKRDRIQYRRRRSRKEVGRNDAARELRAARAVRISGKRIVDGNGALSRGRDTDQLACTDPPQCGLVIQKEEYLIPDYRPTDRAAELVIAKLGNTAMRWRGSAGRVQTLRQRIARLKNIILKVLEQGTVKRVGARLGFD